jgi:hypothetical protein
MATTILSTALDFNNIKNNLKIYLQQQNEFADYDFEASGLSNILDVLAYNTHVNGLIANFATNESFLGTAQLRSSVVSLAEAIGYIPDSRMSSRALVRLSLNLSSAVNRPTTINLPAGTSFTASVDDVSYTFQTLENYTAQSDLSGIYRFADANGILDIPVYEGTLKTKTFYVGAYSENDVYVIPDINTDANTAVVRVYDTATSNTYTTYNNILSATTISAESTLYILKEAPNGYYELTFGDGVNLGRAPTAGNKIVVTYLSTSGSIANGASVFQPTANVVVNSIGYPLTCTTTSRSVGGDDPESIESIRKNAPFQYAAQNRMVTAADYTSLILRSYSQFITDIKSWGGEENLEPKFGTIFTSILFEDDVDAALQASIKTQVEQLVRQLGIVSFNIEYADPVSTFIETEIYFEFNPKLTTLSQNTIESEVDAVVNEYFANTIGSFDQSFRKSNLLTLVDNVNQAILSSFANVRMQQRFVPLLNRDYDYRLRFPVSIASPDDDVYTITSSPFTYQGVVASIKNRLGFNTLQVVAEGTGTVLVDSVGSYNPATGIVNIVSLNPSSVLGGVNYIKISAVPANESAITPQRNDVLRFDADVSFSSPIIVSVST